jgi:hypothetical protein
MSDNFMKRGYLLPQGCKDVLPVFQPHAHAQPKVWKFTEPLTEAAPVIGEIFVDAPVTLRGMVALAETLGLTLHQMAEAIFLEREFTSFDETFAFEFVAKIARKYGYIAKHAELEETGESEEIEDDD